MRAVIGAGYAGLTLARKLQTALPDEATLVVVDESDSHLVQHELHRVVRRPALAEEITIPLTDALDCEIRQARVTDVEPREGTVTLRDDGGDDSEGNWTTTSVPSASVPRPTTTACRGRRTRHAAQAPRARTCYPGKVPERAGG